ncbi:MAG TPA: hypothetical protein VN711_04700, partial [Candidatus Saccharimonadales bacterium]|nr:hypothetical protein [Candidatus Saccharimonadales bacterium]
MRKTVLLGGIMLVGLVGLLFFLISRNSNHPQIKKTALSPTPTLLPSAMQGLEIEEMREKSYPGSQITTQQTLAQGSNYYRYIVSYLSDGNIIYALLTVPVGQKPKNGWPVILLNHG